MKEILINVCYKDNFKVIILHKNLINYKKNYRKIKFNTFN